MILLLTNVKPTCDQYLAAFSRMQEADFQEQEMLPSLQVTHDQKRSYACNISPIDLGRGRR